MQVDRLDLPLSTSSAFAAEAYRAGVDCQLSAWAGTAGHFDRATAADGGFALAHIGRGRIHQTYAQRTEARACAARARDLAKGATRREQQHVNALALTIEGQPTKAIAASLEHLDEFPRDSLVLGQLLGSTGLFAFSGQPDHNAARVNVCERHARHYGTDWWFQNFCGWSLIEGGLIAEGRRLVEQSLTQRPKNGNGAHGLTHAMFEQGEHAAGEAFLAGFLAEYELGGLLNGHLAWHQALLLIERGDIDGALKLYRDWISPAVSDAPPLILLIDVAALLWRVRCAAGTSIELPWQDAYGVMEEVFARPGIPFADIHVAMVLAATGQGERLDKRIAEIDELVAAGRVAPGTVIPALCRAIAAFAQDDHAKVVTILELAIAELVRIGGSHAQREFVDDMLIISCLKSGKNSTARRMLDDRLKRRASPRDSAWLKEAA